MSDDEETGDDMVELMRLTTAQLSDLQKRIRFLERYLRDEGYGPEDLDDDDDDAGIRPC